MSTTTTTTTQTTPQEQSAEQAYPAAAVDAAYVGRLIRAWQAHRLLAVEAGVPDKASKGMPYGHYRDAWVQLCERQQADTAEECWVLLPGLEAECTALYAKGLEAGWNKG